MTTPDAADVYRQEAGELLDSLEGTLLDLDKTPADRDLIDTAFRALHTIKGSGAMFGFDRVAAFTHDFETVFDLVRKGKVAVSQELLAVALAAKDHIRTLIEAPEGADEFIGEAILGNLQGLVAPAVASGSGSGAAAHPMALATATLPPATTGMSTGRPGWHIVIRFQPDVLRNGANPLALLDDLRELGPCAVAAITSSIPELQGLRPAGPAVGLDRRAHQRLPDQRDRRRLPVRARRDGARSQAARPGGNASTGGADDDDLDADRRIGTPVGIGRWRRSRRAARRCGRPSRVQPPCRGTRDRASGCRPNVSMN